MLPPDIHLEEVTYVAGILNNEPDERGTLVMVAYTKRGEDGSSFAVTVNLN